MVLFFNIFVKGLLVGGPVVEMSSPFCSLTPAELFNAFVLCN